MKTTQTIFYRIFAAMQFGLMTLVLTLTIQAAGEVDPAFNGGAFIQPSGTARAIAQQPDGKILFGGGFSVVNGLTRNSLVRVNSDGSIDSSFNPPESLGGVFAIAFQSNGKILIGGSFIGQSDRLALVRLNIDGSYDDSFVRQITFSGSDIAVNDIIVLADDKILIAGNFYYQPSSGITRTKIARLNVNGSDDNTFNPATNFSDPDIEDIDVQPDGKVLGVAKSGGGTNRFLKRLNTDGSEDPTFTALVNLVFDFDENISAVKVLPNGKILIGGRFAFVNNTAKSNLARLNSDGSLDNSFNTTSTPVVTSSAIIYDIEIDANGKIIVAGIFGSFNGVSRQTVARLNENGTLDLSFNFIEPPPTVVFYGYDVLPLADGKIALAGNKANTVFSGGVAVRLNADGTRDTSFSVLLGRAGTIRDIVPQADGKILVAGHFGAIGNAERAYLGRFNADGTADTTFFPIITPAASISINAIAVQPDGKILIGGSLDSGLIRLNPDGSRDTTFNITISPPPTVFDITVQSDGKIIAAGGSITRFNQDGSLDSGFQRASAGGVNKVIVQPDGKILAGGTFTQINGTPRGRIARLNQDGSLDTTFNPLGGANNNVEDFGLQTDGKIVIGGQFTIVNGINRAYIARLNTDGSTDVTFAPVLNSVIYALRIQANGKIIIGGFFISVNGVTRIRLARLNADGSLDSSFQVGSGPNGTVYSLALQSDGKVLVGGMFTTYNGVGRISIVRLLNDAAERTLYDFDGDGRADIAVFRPSNGFWYQLRSQNNGFAAAQFGQSNDRIAPADYDGDGKTDIAVFRDVVPGAGNFAYFYILNSSDNSFRPVQFGATGDVPVSGDWDGDGKADLAVYRDGSLSGGQSYFFYRPSSQPGENFRSIAWGATGDKPLVGDFDGDGRLDAAIFRQSTGQWYILRSSDNQVINQQFGASTDIPVPADYDGDGRANIAVFRPLTGYWYTSTNPATNYGAVRFGQSGDLPVPADYDGDGRADVAVFRPSNGAWYLLRSIQGFAGVQFGANEDKPIPNAFIR